MAASSVPARLTVRSPSRAFSIGVGSSQLHADTARELDDRRTPGPMPSARCAPSRWTVFKRRRHVSRRLRGFLNQRHVGIGVT